MWRKKVNANIFEHINLKINFNIQKATDKATVFRTEFDNPCFTNVLQIANNIHIKNDSIDADGSLIDITTVLHSDMLHLQKCIDNINAAHTEVKELFFSLLTEKFLESLNPEYNE